MLNTRLEAAQGMDLHPSRSLGDTTLTKMRHKGCWCKLLTWRQPSCDDSQCQTETTVGRFTVCNRFWGANSFRTDPREHGSLITLLGALDWDLSGHYRALSSVCEVSGAPIPPSSVGCPEVLTSRWLAVPRLREKSTC
jgi:hypothetical protein